jgi:hypothetical protein
MDTIDVMAESPPSTSEVEAYLAADRNMREASRTTSP